jgi:membrane protease YdiL (CAAX protease family)
VTAPGSSPAGPAGAGGSSPSADLLAADLRGFGPLGILAMLVILLVGNYPVAPAAVLLTLLWARWSRTPLRALGFVRPASWARTVLFGIVLGVVFKCVMKAIVMPLLGADPINHVFHYLVGNRAALPGAVYAMVVGAGFGEETVFRGFLFERFRTLFGSGTLARTATVVITAAGFAAAHYSLQGLAGTEQAAIVGLVFGTIFARTGRIWLLVIAHGAFDLTALAMIYWNLEYKVAHLVFR